MLLETYHGCGGKPQTAWGNIRRGYEFISIASCVEDILLICRSEKNYRYRPEFESSRYTYLHETVYIEDKILRLS